MDDSINALQHHILFSSNEVVAAAVAAATAVSLQKADAIVAP